MTSAGKSLIGKLEEAKRKAREDEAKQKGFAFQVVEARSIIQPAARLNEDCRRLSYIDIAGSIVVMNAGSSPLEFLVSSGEMESGEDEDGMAGVRFHTGIRFRDLVAYAQVNGLKAVNLEASGGGGGPKEVMGYQIDCIRRLAIVRDMVGEDWVYRLLDAVVVKDEWLDLAPESAKSDKRGVKRKQRLKTITALQYGLDKLGSIMGYLMPEDVMTRWPRGAPAMPLSVRRHILVSTVGARPEVPTSPSAR